MFLNLDVTFKLAVSMETMVETYIAARQYQIEQILKFVLL